MKRCSHCRIEKTADEFAWRNKAKGIRQDFCRECKREYNRNWYQLHAVAHKENVARNGKRYKGLALEIIFAANSAPCADSGRSFPPIAMDFDHVEGVKIGNISAMTGRYNIERLREEIAKCEVVCACCHRICTFARLGLTDKMLAS